MTASDHLSEQQFKVSDYQGEVGNNRHITRNALGMLDIRVVQNMSGARGEIPGEHRNMRGQHWEDFKNDVAQHGVKNPIFVWVESGRGYPQLAEGSHRRDAAVAAGHTHIPAEIRYFGHAERERTPLEERYRY
jgi:ParB/Sulfiredoxin domain